MDIKVTVKECITDHRESRQKHTNPFKQITSCITNNNNNNNNNKQLI